MAAPPDNHQFQPDSASAAETAPFAAAPLRLSASTFTNALPIPSIAAFAHGFFGGLFGGIAYSVAPSWLQLRELPYAAATILALATILGAFEVWRVAQARPPGLVLARLLFVMVACLIVLLTLAGLTPTLSAPAQNEPIPMSVATREIVV